MTSIYLIRHGQASFGQQNYDQLSPLGERQASHLGGALATRLGQFDKVYTGTMYRHHQTANACLEGMQQAFPEQDWQQNAGWNEYDHQEILARFGPGMDTPVGVQAYVRKQPDPKKAFEKLFVQAMQRWMSGQHDDEYTESWNHYQQRIKSALQEVAKERGDAKNIAVFTSGGPIALVSQHLLGVPAEHIMNLNWTLLNCGVTKLVATGSRLFVASLNEHAHFEGEHKDMISYK